MSDTKLDERTTRVVLLQAELLDHSGHVRYGLPRGKARSLIAEINGLRDELKWKRLDMAGRWRRG